MHDIPLHTTVAVLIDADNAQLSYLEQVLKMTEYYGQVKICRAYADWNAANLATWRAKIDALNVIERVQVDRVGKNATDHRLLTDAGEILAADGFNGDPTIAVFVIVSGDGDFASACRLLQERGRQVIGIGNKERVSSSIKESCDKFYCLEDLDAELAKLKKRFPIPPNEVRAFFNPLLFAYFRIVGKEWDWVTYPQLDNKLRELVSDYDAAFGQYKLSDWLKNYARDFESDGQRIRRIDPNPEMTRCNKLIEAYLQAEQSDHRAHLGQLDSALRSLDLDYENRFRGKKLSQWIEAYPDTFRLDGDFVIHRNYWSRLNE